MARFSKAQETFCSRKAIFSSAVSKYGERINYTPEASCIKRTSVHVKNMGIKELCDRKVQDFVMAFRARKVPRAGPVSRKPRKLFGPAKPFFVNWYLI